MDVNAVTETNDIHEKAQDEKGKDAQRVMKEANLDDTKWQMDDSAVDESMLEITNNPICCELCLLHAPH